jgi:nucleotide-binding universal stress UspA family protein
MSTPAAGPPRIVVGVRDSETARWALATAIGEARLRGMPLLIVHVAPMPQPVAAAMGGAWSDMIAASRALGAATLRRVLDEVCDGAPGDLEVRALSMIGDPGRILVDMARPGDILVLGRGSRGPLRRLLRPSARRYCARHARSTLIYVEPPAVEDLFGAFEEVAGRPAVLRKRRGERRWQEHDGG